jgi:hypothetical protein
MKRTTPPKPTRGRPKGQPHHPGHFISRKQLVRVRCCLNRCCPVCAGTNQRLEVRDYEQ